MTKHAEGCEKCGNPEIMYWCQNCEHNQEEKGKCDLGCDNNVELDYDYHKECDSEVNKEN